MLISLNKSKLIRLFIKINNHLINNFNFYKIIETI